MNKNTLFCEKEKNVKNIKEVLYQLTENKYVQRNHEYEEKRTTDVHEYAMLIGME